MQIKSTSVGLTILLGGEGDVSRRPGALAVAVCIASMTEEGHGTS